MKRVLSIGQCGPDHASISSALCRHFGAEVVGVDDLSAAVRHFEQGGRPDLVLVNRKLDVDYSDGLAVIRALTSDSSAAGVPVMLVSNYPEYQAEAQAMGAAAGFGKAELSDPVTIEKLRPFLG